ncbi:MAG: hypothetical protein ACT4PK_08190 [Gammaproteobacteria bacterium]
MPPDARLPLGTHEGHGHLRLSLRSSSQLFNSFDPSPFYEKDLDDDAERYLVSWARELHPHADLRLTVYLREPPAEPQPEQWLTRAIHHHFGERMQLARAELRALLRQGRASLAIGLAFLVAMELLASVSAGVLREGLTIAGWVAMWRPLQIYLYDWWPLRQNLRLYGRMSRMPVELRIAA